MSAVLRPDSERLARTLNLFTDAEVGGTPGGGVSRPAGSAADGRARTRFVERARELGLEVRVDDVGNIYAERPGTDPTALPVVVGSHLDTVVPGGRFDGILGVALALETAALLEDAGSSTRRPVVVVNWTGEEGARFPQAMLGSGVIAGKWDGDFARALTDADGIALGDELERIGFLGSSDNRLSGFHVALEAHIEQGTRLEELDADVGVVTTISPVRWARVRVTGVGGHAGGPGPHGRQEAIVAAARMVVAARERSLAEGAFKVTVGTFRVLPGSNNVIPHEVVFNLDIRSDDDERVDTYFAEVSALFESIAVEEGVEVSVDRTWSMTSAPFDAEVRDLLARVATDNDVRWAEVRGSIGHDTLHLAAVGPAAMLFTRTTKGLSHCEEEDAPWEAVLATAQVLANAVASLAETEARTHRAPGETFV
jgi:N-carbamoyl-L-amino-acid hydrolase